MADIKSLKSYLVSLGFSVNQTQLNQFNSAITQAAGTIAKATDSMLGNMLKWESVTIGAFASVGAIAVATAEKIAATDQDYRLWGERMFMSASSARVLKQATDSLGYSLGQIAFDPELRERFQEITGLLQRLEGMQPGGTETALRNIRSINIEFVKFRLEMGYLLRIAVGRIFDALGGETFLARLRSINEYIVAHIPLWSRLFAQYAVPVLKMVWAIMGDIWQIAKDLATVFTNLVGLFTMDSSLMGVANLEKFAHALEKVTVFIGWIVRGLLFIQGILTGGALGAIVGGGVGAIVGSLGGPFGTAAGALGGAAIGAGAGGVFDIGRHIMHALGDGGSDIPAGANLDQVTGAVAQVESGGRQTNRYGGTLTSSAGALGVMQLLPSTARQLGVNPYDAAQNVAGGRAYLNQLYGKYGNWHDALAAYNWGPGNVDRALQLHRAFPSSVEGYVRSVGSHMTMNVGPVNIMQPNATPEQIASAVSERVQRESALTTLQQMQQMRSVYG